MENEDVDYLDEDGYPTDAAYDKIANWQGENLKEIFDFIESLWHLRSWGWASEETDHEFIKDKKVIRYDISTAGWSGNEDIIRAMQENLFLWHLTWVQSRRGGHYIFEIPIGEE
jgi:hypothetical protein